MENKQLEKIELSDFVEACKEIKDAPITSRAPLGYSTGSKYLHGKSREEEVSIRNHSGMFSMLITTYNGRFLFNGGVSMNLPIETAAYILYMAFIQVKDRVSFLPISENVAV